jgi:hypothetical protein
MCAFCWFLLHSYYGSKNVKTHKEYFTVSAVSSKSYIENISIEFGHILIQILYLQQIQIQWVFY